VWLGAALFVVGTGLALVSGDVRYGASVYPIYAYGALLAVSLGVAWWLSARATERHGLPPAAVSRALVAAIAGGLIGARAAYVLLGESGEPVTSAFALGGGGLTLYGGLVAGAASAWVLLRRERVRLLAWGDGAAPGFCVALLIGRVASYLAGSDYGRPLSPDAPVWLGRLGTFPRWPTDTVPRLDGSPAWVDHVTRGALSPSSIESLPVHPTQLYEAVFAAVLFAGVVLLRARQPFRGASCLAAIAVYGIWSVVIETFRGDADRGLLGPLSVAQWCAVVTTGAAAFGLYRSFRLQSR
jgi:phosphatidylglycerol:prolipoprotein diacylglycerol transferase